MSNKTPLPIIKTPEYRLSLPISKKEIVYRPYNVSDEKLLIAASLEKQDNPEFYLDNTFKVIRGLVQNDVEIDNLPAAEIDLFLVNLRAISVGEKVEFAYMDEKENQIKAVVDIADFKISDVDSDHYKIDLVDGVGITMRNITFSQRLKYGVEFKDNPSDAIFQSIVDCVVSIYSKDDIWVVGEDITKEEAKDFIFDLTGQTEKLYSFFKGLPKMIVEATLEDGTKKTFAGDEIDFLA